jgi:hypothetical protein
MPIVVKSVPHKDHRYPTIGDYFIDRESNLQIRVSQELDLKYRFLVILHELIEAFLCQSRGISFDLIDQYDIAYELQHPNNLDEPGETEDSPYRNEHNFATYIEKVVARELDVDMEEYNKACEALLKETK